MAELLLNAWAGQLTNSVSSSLGALYVSTSLASRLVSAGVSSSNPIRLTLQAASTIFKEVVTDADIEVVLCTAANASNGILTVQRGQEGTQQAWATGDYIEARLTAGGAAALGGGSGSPTTPYQVGDATGDHYAVSFQQYGRHLGMRNLLMNGDFEVSHRGAGYSSAATAYMLDRWRQRCAGVYANGDLNYYSSTSPSSPPGHDYVLQISPTSGTSGPAATDYVVIEQPIEAQITEHLEFNTANAASMVLSFWVYSGVSGPFSGYLQNYQLTRSYVFQFTVNNVNAWEYKTVVIPGDTYNAWTRGGYNQWGNLGFCLGAGSSMLTGTPGQWLSGNFIGAGGTTLFAAQTSGYFCISGAQFERGALATPFDKRPLTLEELLCKRYFQILNPQTGLNAYYSNPTAGDFLPLGVKLPVVMRAVPTCTYYSFAWANLQGSPAIGNATKTGFRISQNVNAAGTLAYISNGLNGYVTCDADY